MALVKTVNFYDFAGYTQDDAGFNIVTTAVNPTIDTVSLTNLTQLQPVNNRSSDAYVRWLLNSSTSTHNVLDLASYGKNKYDYIIITFDIWLVTSVTSRICDVYLQDPNQSTPNNYNVDSSHIGRLDKSKGITNQRVNVILNNDTILAGSNNEITITIKMIHGGTNLDSAESIYISECKMYVINRLRLQNQASTQTGEITVNSSSFNTRDDTNTLTGFDFSADVIKLVPYSQTNNNVQYSIPSTNYSSGNPQTIFFNAYIDRTSLSSEVKFTINNEVVKTISPDYNDLLNYYRKPDHDFDFTQVDSDGIVYDSYNSNYKVQFYNSPTISSSEGVILSNADVTVSTTNDNTAQYGRIQKAGEFKYIFLVSDGADWFNIFELQCWVNDTNVALSSGGASATFAKLDDHTDTTDAPYTASSSASVAIDGNTGTLAHGNINNDYNSLFITLPSTYNLDDLQRIIVYNRTGNLQSRYRTVDYVQLLDANKNVIVEIDQSSDTFTNIDYINYIGPADDTSTSAYSIFTSNNTDYTFNTNEMWGVGGDSYTIEVVGKWYNFYRWGRMFDFAETDVSTDDNMLLANYSTDLTQLAYRHNSDDAGVISLTSSTNTLVENQETHMIMTYNKDTNKAKLYINGTLVATQTSVGTLSNIVRERAWFGRSNYEGADKYLDGSIRLFRMWDDHAFSEEDIYSIFHYIPIYYTSADSISSNIPLRVDITGDNGNISTSDIIYIDRMINIAPTAANIFDSGLEVNNTMNVTGNIFNSNLIGEIAMFYQDNEIPPFGYLWCDGAEISTDDDEKYRTLIEILRDEPRGSSSVDITKSCYLPHYMEDSTGCHLLQTDTQSPSNGPLYTNFSYNYKDSTTNPDNNIVGKYTLDSDYFPSHNHTISNNISPSATITHNLVHDELNVQANNLYRFQHINPAAVGDAGGDSNDENASNKSHYHNALSTEKVYIENPSQPWEPSYTPTTVIYSQLSEYQATITKTVNSTFDADITLGNYGSAPTTTHIPVSFKVKYAIKYL